MTDGKFIFQEKKLKATFKIDMRPSKLSQLENDIGLVNGEYVSQNYINKEQGADNAGKILKVGEDGTITLAQETGGGTTDLSDYYTKEETNELIPTKVSELENDSGYATTEWVNEKIGDISTVLDTINGEVV